MSRLVSSKLKISENKTARYSYRKLGKGSQTVLVTVDDLQDRSAIFRAARTIKPDSFFVSESLIHSKQQLFYELRKMKRDSRCFHSVFCFKGQLYIKRNIDGNKILICSIEQANEIISKPHQESVSKPRPEIAPKPSKETISRPRQESVSGPRLKIISEPRQEMVSGPHQGMVSKPHQETVSKPRFEM